MYYSANTMFSKTSLKNLVDNNTYQVFLFTCPAYFLMSMWRHSWVVVNSKGRLSRWEVLYKRNRTRPEFGYIHENYFPLFDGIEVFSLLDQPRWNATLVGQIEGGENSSAQKMCQFIENTPKTYEHKDEYFLFGPNSNTYVQWILDNSPEFNGKLGWNAFGKDYKSMK
jgi:hypothetical protein